MTTLPNMGLILPTRGPSGAGVWDDTLDENLGLADAHDHSSGKGVRIKTAGISIDADLSFGSLYGPTNLHRITFASIVALGANNKSLFVNTADNELYWRSNAGANVKLTSGSTLNVAAFTGGIGGDYAAVGAEVAYEDANDRYTLKQQGGVWARIASGELRLSETGTSESVFAGISVPAALASSYTLTLPLTLPASTNIVQMTSAGVMSASNTISVAIAAASASFSGLVTANAGLTAAVNTHVTVSGTGEFKHGSFTTVLSSIGGASAGASSLVNGSAVMRVGAAGNDWHRPLDLDVGQRVQTISVRLKPGAVGAIVTASLVKDADGVITSIAVVGVSSGTAYQTLTSATINHTVAAGGSYSVQYSFTGSASNSDLAHITLVRDRP
jgi:hypothetical protein